MLEKIITALAAWIIMIISTLGYGGVALLMAIESACIPLPSEIIMAFAGAIGCVIGSIPAYYLGAYGGRTLIEKYGKWVLISHHDLELADRWFAKYGEITI